MNTTKDWIAEMIQRSLRFQFTHAPLLDMGTGIDRAEVKVVDNLQTLITVYSTNKSETPRVFVVSVKEKR